ncbi:MAG TPA: hypothetical protein VFE33_13950 [Thermoanaerobaculia bacterium]|nr:hypothetical protein [Thermoanaerobaculia bacterium]
MPDYSIARLIRKLPEGWGPSHGLAHEFVQCWREAFHANAQIKESDEGSLYFTTELPDIRLHGTDDMHCLLLARSDDIASEVLKTFKRKAVAPGRLLVVFPFREEAALLTQEALGSVRHLLVPPLAAREILLSDQPQEKLKKLLREQLPIRSLIPYNYLRPAMGSLFFGRQAELDRLLQEDDVSFSIAGPGRIGKTSILKQYRRALIRTRDPRAARSVEIDFYPCGDTSTTGVARFLAMKIESSSRSYRMTADGLADFLRFQRAEHGGPLELLLDEVDAVCRGLAFDIIGDAAKQGLCRLILCGRGELLDMMLSPDSPLACRLELLRPGPLESEPARELLLRPLSDLGLTLEQPEHLVERVFELSGCLPHLLQFYGKKLAELTAESASSVVVAAMIETLGWDFDSAQYITSPLSQLEDEERLLALALLKERPGELTISSVRALATAYGLVFSHARTLEILNRLVISNILSWRRGSFSIANGALPSYAEQLGYLDFGIADAKAGLRATGPRLAQKR